MKLSAKFDEAAERYSAFPNGEFGMQTIEQVKVGSASHRLLDRKSNAGQCLYKTFDYNSELGEECGLVAAVAASVDGSITSRRALHALARGLCKINSREQTRQVSPNWPSFIRKAFDQANVEVCKEAGWHPGGQVIRVSLTTAVIAGDALYIGHIGDSRAYLIRNGQIARLTQDHTQDAERMREDKIIEHIAWFSGRHGLLTKAIGMEKSIQPDIDAVGLRPGDRIVLGTAGTTRRLSDTNTLLVACSSMDARKAARALMTAADTTGEQQSPAFIVIDCYGEAQPLNINIPITLKHPVRWAIAALAITLGLLLVDAAYLGDRRVSNNKKITETAPKFSSGHRSRPNNALLDLSGRPVKIAPMR